LQSDKVNTSNALALALRDVQWIDAESTVGRLRRCLR